MKIPYTKSRERTLTPNAIENVSHVHRASPCKHSSTEKSHVLTLFYLHVVLGVSSAKLMESESERASQCHTV
jgi:hypothetical protein